MKLGIAIVAATGALVACGKHSFVTVESFSATRGGDNHVTVSAIVGCSSTTLGDDCMHPDHPPFGNNYCAMASWIQDGGTIDFTQACSTAPLADGHVTNTLTLRSNIVIPQDAGVVIDVEVDGGDGVGENIPRQTSP